MNRCFKCGHIIEDGEQYHAAGNLKGCFNCYNNIFIELEESRQPERERIKLLNDYFGPVSNLP